MHLNLPLHFDPLRECRTCWGGDRRTTEGELLWPEHLNEEIFARVRDALGSQHCAAQYEQNPSSDTAGVIHRSWLRQRWTVLPPGGRYIQSWDMTFKETTDGSFVVGQVWYALGSRFYLVDQVRARADFPTTCQMLQSLSAKWPQSSAKLVEDKANGPAVIDALKRRVTGLIAQAPDGSKDARLAAVSPLFEAGNVFLPDPATHPWVHDFVEELAAAAPAHDDQRDACAQALRYLHGKSTRLVEAMARLAKDGNRMI